MGEWRSYDSSKIGGKKMATEYQTPDEVYADGVAVDFSESIRLMLLEVLDRDGALDRVTGEHLIEQKLRNVRGKQKDMLQSDALRVLDKVLRHQSGVDQSEQDAHTDVPEVSEKERSETRHDRGDDEYPLRRAA